METNIEFFLSEVGGTLEDTISLTIYFIHPQDLPEIQAIRSEFLLGFDPPVSTSPGVAGLGHKDFLVEPTPVAVVTNER